MKTAILCALLLSGCATKCPDCLTLTKPQLVEAMGAAWTHGFRAGEDAADIRRMRPL